MAEQGEFAGRLRRLREAAFLTQEELAERAGLTVNAVGALERGERRRPYPNTVRALADALALDAPARQALAEAARRGQAATPAPSDLAKPTTLLLGRDAELAEALSLVRNGGVRLLTVTGPGGVGKTRLALELAAELALDFPAGVAVVELAAVREVELVLPTVSHALGLTHLDPGRALDAVAEHLGDRPTLLVLDNLEHVVRIAPDVAKLIARCRGLVVLGTSRAPLRVRPEQDYPLAPLAVPAFTDVAAVAASPAAQMFLDRARAVAPHLALTAATAPAVAAICRRLDGLPLALELAAAHARLLPPAALLDRLDSSLGLPRSRDLPERQRTMSATLDWSHDLLTRNEQRLFRRLSVFVGGFSLVAVERVAGSGDGDVLEALAGLVEQSLVTPEWNGEARYRMLEPVREDAVQRLRTAGEAQEFLDRHAAYVVELGRQARDGLRGADQAVWLDRLELDHGNLRLAVGTLAERREGGALARLMADTWLYWALRGHAGEGVAWLETIVGEIDSAGPPADQAAAYLALAGLRYAGGDVRGTRTAAERSVAAARTADERSVLTEAEVLLGGALVFEGDLDGAVAPLADAARRAEEMGDAFAIAQAKFTLGQRHFRVGSLSAAETELADAEAIARTAGLPFTLASVLNMRAVVAEVAGDDDTALAQLTEAAELAGEVGTTWTLVYTLPALAVLAARRARPDLAATLFAAGRATAETSGLAVSFPPSREGAEHWLTVVRTAMPEAAWRRAHEAGRTLPVGDVADLARQISRPAPW